MATPNSSLLFIPDITGFTEFVNNTETNHSQHIISELLEIIIDSNNLGLTVSEIEGDAVFFYLEGAIPSIQEVANQAKAMFEAFHKHLLRYENRRICNCGACRTAARLSLKFIVHAGPVGFIHVKNITKPHGYDVVVAHKLLKNNVAFNEYLLLSDGYMNAVGSNEPLPTWLTLDKGATSYNKLGELSYAYAGFNELLNNIEPEPITKPEKVSAPIVVKGFIYAAANKIYEHLIDLDLRASWNGLIRRIEHSGQINQVGERHLCILDSGDLEIETVINDFGEKKLVYGEKVINPKGVKQMINYFILEPKAEGTEVTLEMHLKHYPIIGVFMAPIINKKIKASFKQILEGLKQAIESPISVTS